MPLTPGRHLDLLLEALSVEAGGQRALLDGDDGTATERLSEASTLYRQSWEAAGPDAYGRLIGMLKAAVIAGSAREPALYVDAVLTGALVDSPVGAYAQAIAALVLGNDDRARRAAVIMTGGSEAFGRAAAAITALVDRDAGAYEGAIRAIVRDFEGRDEHLTGVPIADTALMLERLAEPRGLAVRPTSALLPQP